MTCVSREGALALYVEGDLPYHETLALEAHLSGCATCRSFLAGLRASQRALRELAAEPLDDATSASLRARVISAARKPRPRPSTVERWAIAASLAGIVAATLWRAMPAVHAPSAPGVAALPAVASRPTLEAPPPTREEPPRPTPSTLRAAPVVSPHVERPAAVPRLSPEDADQLARAVVAISRIRSVEEALREPPVADPSPTPLIRMATADPNVVIYWRLEPGGE
jgi:anti-sigma factor RsiW